MACCTTHSDVHFPILCWYITWWLELNYLVMTNSARACIVMSLLKHKVSSCKYINGNYPSACHAGHSGSVSRHLLNKFQQVAISLHHNNTETSCLDYCIEQPLVECCNHTTTLRVMSETATLVVCQFSSISTYYQMALLHSMTNYRTIHMFQWIMYLRTREFRLECNMIFIGTTVLLQTSEPLI